MQITASQLIDFENHISDLYQKGVIRAPVHLSGGNEVELIEMFKKIGPNDFCVTSYRNHYHALLKGIPPDWVESEIREGRSMYLINREHGFYSSSIVPGQLAIGLGVAMAYKRRKENRTVWAFCGDMASRTGEFSTCVRYAYTHSLPIRFIVEDDGLSVYTPTGSVWKDDVSPYGWTWLWPGVKRYRYKRKWPHHGMGVWVDFGEPGDAVERHASETRAAMKELSEDPSTLFIGQSVRYKGSPMFNSFADVPDDRKIEMPIMEEVQMGISIGLSMCGYTVVSVYPRMDFLMCAMNQLVNHLDKLEMMSRGQFVPHVIVRTMIGSKVPLDGGPQHTQDHTYALACMMPNTHVEPVREPANILTAYRKAMQQKGPSVIVEYVC